LKDVGIGRHYARRNHLKQLSVIGLLGFLADYDFSISLPVSFVIASLDS